MMAANKKAEINYDFKKMGCKISSLGIITFFLLVILIFVAEDLLKKMLEKNPATRITANSALKHE